jgi:hypothetical protein
MAAPVIGWNSSGTFGSKAGNTVSTGTDNVIAGSFGTTAQTIYQNGGAAATNTANISGPNYSSTSLLCVGTCPGVSANPASVIYWAGIWNRLLTVAEHAVIGANVNAIWSIFRNPLGSYLWQNALTFPNFGRSVERPWSRPFDARTMALLD